MGQHLPFASRQPFRIPTGFPGEGTLGKLAYQSLGDAGRKQCIAGRTHSDGMDQLFGRGVFQQEPARAGP